MTAAEAIEAVCDAWTRLDNDAIAAGFAEDGVFDDPLHERRLVGRDDIRETNAGAVAALRECRVTLGHVVEDGHVGIAEGRFRGIDTDGNAMDFPFAMVVEIRDGEIARMSEYFDTRPLVA